MVLAEPAGSYSCVCALCRCTAWFWVACCATAWPSAGCRQQVRGHGLLWLQQPAGSPSDSRLSSAASWCCCCRNAPQHPAACSQGPPCRACGTSGSRGGACSQLLPRGEGGPAAEGRSRAAASARGRGGCCSPHGALLLLPSSTLSAKLLVGYSTCSWCPHCKPCHPRLQAAQRKAKQEQRQKQAAVAVLAAATLARPMASSESEESEEEEEEEEEERQEQEEEKQQEHEAAASLPAEQPSSGSQSPRSHRALEGGAEEQGREQLLWPQESQHGGQRQSAEPEACILSSVDSNKGSAPVGAVAAPELAPSTPALLAASLPRHDQQAPPPEQPSASNPTHSPQHGSVPPRCQQSMTGGLPPSAPLPGTQPHAMVGAAGWGAAHALSSTSVAASSVAAVAMAAAAAAAVAAAAPAASQQVLQPIMPGAVGAFYPAGA